MNHSYRGKQVLVTGGAGFIGSELVRFLVADGAVVVAVDNLVNGKRENLQDFLEDGSCRLVVADIRDSGTMESLVMGVDTVFHLACLGVRHSIHSPEENHEVNGTGTLRLLAAARKQRVRRFVYVSTSEVYGSARSVPMTEEHPVFPLTVYGASKLAGECYSRAFHASYGFPAVVVRPFNAYGPRCHHEGDSGEVIPRFLLRCLAGRPMVVFGDGHQTRDFTYVSDTARGIALAGLPDEAVGRTINLGSGSEISINDLVGQIAEVVGRLNPSVIHDDARPGDVRRLYAHVGRADELLGFKPRVSLTEGLARLKDWYLSSGKSAQKLLEEEVLHNWEASETRPV